MISAAAAMLVACNLAGVVQADNLPAGLTAENTVTVNKKVFVRNPKQSAKVNAKRKALINAENALSELQAKIKGQELATGGASGFFKRIAESSSDNAKKQDAGYAYNLLTGQAEDTPDWYGKYVRLGQSTDATSVQNLYKTLPYYDQFIKLRQKNDESVPNVSLSTVAAAMLDADYSSHVMDHARHFDGSENLAWGSPKDPNSAWMSEESIWNKAVAKNPSLAQYKHDPYGMMQADASFYEKVGHYLNLIAPKMESIGYALNTQKNQYDDTEAFDADYANASYSIAEYKTAVTDYYNEIEKPDQVKAAKAKVKAAKKSLQSAIKQSKKAKSRRAKAKKHYRRVRRHNRNRRN